MKRASYRDGLKLISVIHGGDLSDYPLDDPEGLEDAEGLIGVVMLAELFQVRASKVVADYLRAVARGAA